MRNPFKIKCKLAGTSARYYEVWGPGGKGYFGHANTMKDARDMSGLLFAAFSRGMQHAVKLIEEAEG